MGLIDPFDRPHSTYVLLDRPTRSRFKIGIGPNPSQDAKEEVRRRYPNAPKRAQLIKIHACWRFRSYFAALYVQRTIIDLLQGFDYRDSGDGWHEIDEEALDFILQLIQHPIEAVQNADDAFSLSSPAVKPTTSYGRYRLQTGLARLSRTVTRPVRGAATIVGLVAFAAEVFSLAA